MFNKELPAHKVLYEGINKKGFVQFRVYLKLKRWPWSPLSQRNRVAHREHGVWYWTEKGTLVTGHTLRLLRKEMP